MILNFAVPTQARNRCQAKRAFTILEVLIALVASLLMMLALTRAFKLIGDKITTSQSELELSGTLRNITFSMRDELARMTPEMVAPQPRDASSGYFTYYEGPWTDGTTTLINNVGPQPGYLPTSRYGDIDDYLAFTAKAKPGAPFVGMIPRGVLEAHRFEAHRNAGNPANTFVTYDGIAVANYTTARAFELVPFYSDYAEIVYFCAPEWVRDELGQPVYDEPPLPGPNSFNPLFVDNVNEVGTATPGDDIPDRLRLHRRVLLIRPDLNMTPTRIATISGAALVTGTDEDIGQLPILMPIPRNNPPAPSALEVVTLASEDDRFQVGPWNPALNWPGSVNDTVRPPWLTGVARVQQMMDLSVARITNSWSTPGGTSRYGMPADNSPSLNSPAGVAANSLNSLTRPENRFAHVRMPLSLVGGSTNQSTMPLLALGPPHAYLTTQEQLTQATAATTDDRFGQGIGGNPASYGNFTMVGFMRPEFVLTDYSVANRSTAATAAATSNQTFRGGADIIAPDVLAFDVQVFDENAPNFVWMGSPPMNVPGNPNPPDDDGDGTNNEIDELGLPNTDDALVTVDSPALNPLVGTAPSVFASTYTGPINPTAPLSAGTNEYIATAPGSFVDYGFARLPGGMVGGFDVIDRLPSAQRAALGGMFATNFSGRIADTADSNLSRYPLGWSNSGRFIVSSGARVSGFVQPVLDTWTESYDGDGFDQPLIPAPPAPPGLQFNATGSTLSGTPARTRIRTRIWSNTAESVLPGPGFEDGSTSTSQSVPPSSVMPRAIKISIRVYDRISGEVRQQSVIQEFAR